MEVDTEAVRDSGHGPGPGAESGLAAGLRVAVGRVTRRLRQAHAVGDLSLSEVSVLARLAGEGPGSPSALAESERVRPQAMATTLAGLTRRGLVRRTPDAADGRRSIVAVTEEGRAVLAQRRSASVRRLEAVLDEFSAQDRAALAAAVPLLERLAERL
ncbi:MarR family transcriptional regulator [Streptomyces griseoviridis]|uniref:MarR family winged helix-turn-helix transcriptional regulator n=1 Tax=Streptomyces TaxID=1883 RepID=UPI002474E9E2|nr:MarR family transcriptional regulator [Streptomyces sp. MAA16]MDH6699384.1 DNA-binding MarR family transcriptional regulator [Streptomyces sp. MAA16]